MKREYAATPPGEADRLNGIEWTGKIIITALLWQWNYNGQWKWWDTDGFYTCFLTKTRGHWQIGANPLWTNGVELIKPTQPFPTGWQH
jgi:hypothetical protein